MKRGPKRKPIGRRLLARHIVRGECWIYTGAKTKDGYGVIGAGRGRGSQIRAHRAAYQEFIGAIPVGMMVCHRCDTPLCIRPEHLFLGTAKDNTADMIAKGRRATLRGVSHPMSKLTDQQVAELRARRKSGEKLIALSTCYQISFQHVSAIARGVCRA